MIRRLYILLLRLHPRSFRQRFGDEMLGIFDDSPQKSSLMTDGLASLARQWAFRRHESATAAADSAIPFYLSEPEIPSMSVLIPAALIALLAFSSICFTMSHRWRQTGLIVGSHHPSPSHLRPAHTDALPVEDLPAEVKMTPHPYHAPISAYFRFLLVLGALDADQDTVPLSDLIHHRAPAAAV